MAVFIVLRPSLLTIKLKSVIRHNLGHSRNAVPGLQHATTLGAAKSLAKTWAKDIPG